MSNAQIQPARELRINKGLPRQIFNRLVTAILRSPLHGVAGLDRFAMVLRYTGRKSGRQYSLPLAYLRDGDVITTFALFTNTVWWKNLRDGATVTVRLAGNDYAGVADIIQEPEQVLAGLRAFAAQTRGGYYALPRTPDGAIDPEALREAARTRLLIQIRLAPQPIARERSPRMKSLMRAVVAAHTAIYRLSGGRVWGRIGTTPVLLLTTTGRKTGRRLTIPLNYVADAGRYIVVGAMGGAPKNPAWVLNLQADPRALVQTGGRRREMRAAIAQGDERERLWALLTAQFPGFATMQERTTRQFPIVVLQE